MKERFEGGGRSHLLDALMRQEFVGGERAIAEKFASIGDLQEFPTGAELIKEKRRRQRPIPIACWFSRLTLPTENKEKAEESFSSSGDNR